jgi:cytochrome b
VTLSRPRETRSDGRVPLWDAAVRLLHWLLAALVLFCYFVDDDGGAVHRTVGYVAVGVVFARLLWSAGAAGVNGFASLRPSLARTREYLRAGAPRSAGRDPLGVWMVWLLWSLVLALGVTGWMTRLDAFWGDETLHDVHAAIAHALVAAAAVHVAGVAAMSWRWGENLVLAMLTGRRRDTPPPP